MKKWVAGLVLLLTLSSLPAFSASPPKPGSVCSKQGIAKTYKGKKYICIRSGKKLVWNTGVVVKKPNTTSSPTPTPTTLEPPAPTPTSPPTPYPSPNSTSLPSPKPSSPSVDYGDAIEEYIDKIIIEARKSNLNFLGDIKWIHERDNFFKSENETIEGFKKSIDFYSKLGIITPKPIVMIASTQTWLTNQIQTICKDYKPVHPLAGFFYTSTECKEGSGIVTAKAWEENDGYSKASFEHQSILSHEYFHQIQANLNFGAVTFTPKWFNEGGAVFFSLITYAGWNEEKTYRLIFEQHFNSPRWKDYLYTSCLSQRIEDFSLVEKPNPEGVCAYSKGVLVVEYLIYKYGMGAYFKLLESPRIQSQEASTDLKSSLDPNSIKLWIFDPESKNLSLNSPGIFLKNLNSANSDWKFLGSDANSTLQLNLNPGNYEIDVIEANNDLEKYDRQKYILTINSNWEVTLSNKRFNALILPNSKGYFAVSPQIRNSKSAVFSEYFEQSFKNITGEELEKFYGDATIFMVERNWHR